MNKRESVEEESTAGAWVLIARVVKPRGNRGEVLVEPFTNRLERFQEVGRVFPRASGEVEPAAEPLAIEEAWDHQGRWILKFARVDSISDAEALRGLELVIPETERPPLPEGEYYFSDLVGCEVSDWRSGELLGSVATCDDASGQVLLEVKAAAGGELLIPLVKEICVEISVAARRIRVNLPEGLRELNR